MYNKLRSWSELCLCNYFFLLQIDDPINNNPKKQGESAPIIIKNIKGKPSKKDEGKTP